MSSSKPKTQERFKELERHIDAMSSRNRLSRTREQTIRTVIKDCKFIDTIAQKDRDRARKDAEQAARAAAEEELEKERKRARSPRARISGGGIGFLTALGPTRSPLLKGEWEHVLATVHTYECVFMWAA